MSTFLIEMALFLLLSLAAYRWGADTRDGRDWRDEVDNRGARPAGCPAGACAHR
jgi:hypothetical protein